METEGKAPAPNRTTLLVTALAGLAALVVFFLYPPQEYGFYPTCPIFKYTGYHCAGCGMQRALHDLLHLNLSDMWRNNAMLPLYLLLGMEYGYQIWRGKRPMIMSPLVIWGVLALIFAYSLLRNLPFPPFDGLAPVSLGG